MLKVGLTGSIAVGKSFVCDVLREMGCHVLDADNTAREVVAAGTHGFEAVVKEFGLSIIHESGEIDRKRLGAIIFADEEKRKLLNSIVHPLVIEEQDRWLGACAQADADGIAVVDAALMIESGSYRRFDKIIVVWCEPAIQLERLMLRDNLSRNEAEKRVAAQMSQDEKKHFADHLIDTSDGFESTRQQVADLLRSLRA